MAADHFLVPATIHYRPVPILQPSISNFNIRGDLCNCSSPKYQPSILMIFKCKSCRSYLSDISSIPSQVFFNRIRFHFWNTVLIENKYNLFLWSLPLSAVNIITISHLLYIWQINHTMRCMVCRQLLIGEKEEVITHCEKCHGIQIYCSTTDWWNGSISVTYLSCGKKFNRSLTTAPCKRKIITADWMFFQIIYVLLLSLMYILIYTIGMW